MKLREPKVHLKQIELMQRLMDAAICGYTDWICGSVKIERAQEVVKRFAIEYQMDIDRNARARRKRAGLGNARMILFDADMNIDWWLMVTPPENGKHPAHAAERLKNAFNRDGRIIVDGAYELIRLTKKGAKKPTLTWRMTQERYQEWRDLIIESVRHGSKSSAHQLLINLYTTPGFSGVRSQVGHLAALYRSEVIRSGRNGLPELPKRLRYVRRLRDSGITLSQFVRAKNNLLKQEKRSNEAAKEEDCNA